MRALNVLIGALRADAQPMVTETNTCLLTGGRHRSRRQRLADARQGPGHAGDHGPGLRGVRSSRRQHFMPGLEIDGLWWCARCLRFAQSETESVIRSASSEDSPCFALLLLCPWLRSPPRTMPRSGDLRSPALEAHVYVVTEDMRDRVKSLEARTVPG